MCSVKKVFLEMSQNSQESTCARVSFLVKLQILTQVLSCEFCEISKNTFCYRAPLVATSLHKGFIGPHQITSTSAGKIVKFIKVRIDLIKDFDIDLPPSRFPSNCICFYNHNGDIHFRKIL